MASLVFDAGLAILTIAVAGWTTVARDPFAAVVGFVVYGLLLALVWVRLAAVDVALTEAAIGSGLTGTLLLGAAARLRGDEAPAAEQPGVLLRFVAALLSACVAAGLAGAILLLPENAPTLAPAAAQNAAATGLGNPVTNVLMAFRAMDTLLEKVVLLLALVGVWSLASDRFWGGRPGLRSRSNRMAPSPSLRACCRRSGSWWASMSCGRAPIVPAVPSRPARSSLPCGCS